MAAAQLVYISLQAPASFFLSYTAAALTNCRSRHANSLTLSLSLLLSRLACAKNQLFSVLKDYFAAK